MRWFAAAGAIAVLGVLGSVLAHAANPPSPLGVVHSSASAHDLDLADLVPRGGTLDHVWFVPRGRGTEQIVVASQPPPRPGGRRWQLTLWNPQGRDPQGVRWVPHTLIGDSPYPIADWSGGSAVRLADVTGDGHDDLLLSVGIAGSNHASTAISVFATFGRDVRRIYGRRYYEERKDGGRVPGRLISETTWGTRGGLLWFDEPRGGSSVCCPAFRLHYDLRWTGHGWQPLHARRVRQHY